MKQPSTFINYDEFINVHLKSQLGYVGWKDKNSLHRDLNPNVLKFLGCENKDQIVGFSDADLPWKDLSDVYVMQDKETLAGASQININVPLCLDNTYRVTIAQKIPLVCSEKIIGVACSIIPLTLDQLFNLPLMMTNNLSRLNYSKDNRKKKKSFHYKELKFSYREAQCLSLYLRGATMHEIAEKFCRASRTIEKYFDSLREKLGCTKRSYVFEKAIQYGFIDLMFMVIE